MEKWYQGNVLEKFLSIERAGKWKASSKRYLRVYELYIFNNVGQLSIISCTIGVFKIKFFYTYI